MPSTIRLSEPLTPWMENYIPPTEYITRWITDDGKEHVQSIPNIDRFSKWQHVDTMLELMQNPKVVEIGTYRVISGEEKRGNLCKIFKARIQRVGAPYPDWVREYYANVDVFGIVDEYEYKTRAVFLP